MSDKVSGELSFGTDTTVSGSALTMKHADGQASVLVADVSGNVRLHEKLSGAEAVRAVDRCVTRMERAVEAFGGRLARIVGDELMAAFDTADEAFQAALEMQQRVADLPPVSGVKLAIRVGFSYGSVSESEEGFVGEAVSAAAHLAGLAKPGQVLISAQARAVLSSALRQSTRDLGLVAAQGHFPEMMTFDVVAPEPEPTEAAARSAGAPVTQGGGFSLHYAGEAMSLDGGKGVIKMGRNAESDLVIRDRRASRNHAKIERRGDKVILIDTSTNGTFVTSNGKPEFFVRREECVLLGKGVICFAASATSVDADCALFELL